MNYHYDGNGNMTEVRDANSNPQRQVAYDPFNKPIKITATTAGGSTNLEFAYGSNQQRFFQLKNATEYIAYIDKMLEVYGVSNDPSSVINEKLYIGDYAVIDITDSSAETRFLHRDRLGSVVTVSAETGQVVNQSQRGFDPYGKPRENDWADSNSADENGAYGDLNRPDATTRGFTSHEHLNSVDLIHMNGRAYDYNLGRFLSVDPFIQFPANSQSLNPYSYILNNPMSGTDPSGYLVNAAEQECAASGSCRGRGTADGGLGLFQAWYVASGLSVAGPIPEPQSDEGDAGYSVNPGSGNGNVDLPVPGAADIEPDQAGKIDLREQLKQEVEFGSDAEAVVLLAQNNPSGTMSRSEACELLGNCGREQEVQELQDNFETGVDIVDQVVTDTVTDPTTYIPGGVIVGGVKAANRTRKAADKVKDVRQASEKSENRADFSHNYKSSVGASQRVPAVLQTGGNTLNKHTAKILNEQLGQNLGRREWGRALEELMTDLGLPGNHHARLLDNGDYVDDAGNILGNLQDYLP